MPCSSVSSSSAILKVVEPPPPPGCSPRAMVHRWASANSNRRKLSFIGKLNLIRATEAILFHRCSPNLARDSFRPPNPHSLPLALKSRRLRRVRQHLVQLGSSQLWLLFRNVKFGQLNASA